MKLKVITAILARIVFYLWPLGQLILISSIPLMGRLQLIDVVVLSSVFTYFLNFKISNNKLLIPLLLFILSLSLGAIYQIFLNNYSLPAALYLLRFSLYSLFLLPLAQQNKKDLKHLITYG